MAETNFERLSTTATLTVPFGYTQATYSCSAQMLDELGNSSEVALPNFLTITRTRA